MRVLLRPMLTVAWVFFLCVVLTSCGGGFFTHPSVTSAYISPATATMATGKTAQLAVYGIYSDGSTQKLGEDLTAWSSSDTTVATISSPGGLVTGAAAGSATITATTTVTIPGTGCRTVVNFGNGPLSLTETCNPATTATFTSTVPISVTASDVNRAVINTTQGSTLSQVTATAPAAAAAVQFYAYGNGDASNDLTQAVTWTSSNPNVATIASGLPSGNGVAIAVAAGTTNITASATNSAGQVVSSQTIVLTVQ